MTEPFKIKTNNAKTTAAPKKAADPELVVFSLTGDAVCDDCGEVLPSHEFFFKKGERGYCMECADLDHLIYLMAGDAALTRRAKKYSGLHAVVVRWNRRRNRYERQGLLVEAEALDQAETECIADAGQRAQRREKSQVRIAEQDRQYVADFAAAVRQRYPLCPASEERQIAEHACRKYSNRVGRSASAKQLDEKAITLAVQAHVRHVHTPYDALLMRGLERQEARDAIRQKANEVLATWRGCG